MNIVTQEIMKRFDLTAEAAEGVKFYIYDFCSDMSECSIEERARTLNLCYNKWRSIEMKKMEVFIYA